jgi:hypothetical protein
MPSCVPWQSVPALAAYFAARDDVRPRDFPRPGPEDELPAGSGDARRPRPCAPGPPVAAVAFF